MISMIIFYDIFFKADNCFWSAIYLIDMACVFIGVCVCNMFFKFLENCLKPY